MSSCSSSTVSKRERKPLYPRGWGSGNVAYVDTFCAFSMAVLGRSSLEIGDKIILPSQALQSINRLKLPFPLIFEVRKWQKSSPNILSKNEVMNQYKRRIVSIYRSTNPAKINKIDKWLRKHKDNPHDLYTKICKTYGIIPKAKIIRNRNKQKQKQKQKSFGKQYCSVYEFSSPQPDSAYLPHWMMQNLGIDEGHKVEIESQFNIPKGTSCTLQPFKQEFMDKVSTIGYKATLEHSLRHYSVLSLNQRIVVEFNHFPFECIVKAIKPADAVSILGSTDLEIEFESPLEASSYCYSSSSSSSSSLDIIIDGALLKQLGVPLDYNEQNNLAAMMIENRNHHKEEEEKERERETEKETEKEKKECRPAPNEVECNNCGKYIHSMSIQMHELHCIREYISCKICNECIRHQNEREHFKEFHEEITCICNQICIGNMRYDRHQSDECKLRLRQCGFCKKSDIASMEIEKHEAICKESSVICQECNESYKLAQKTLHDCGIICVLCEERITDSKDKLLHLLTMCKERRAICNYCGIFRMCIDMEQHRKFCGSRSEKCSKCNEFVSLMNMEPHLQSNCQWFNNNQLSAKNIKKNNNQGKVESNPESNLESNPYIDTSLFALLKSNHEPNLIDIDNNVRLQLQLCPHCTNNDLFMDEEEFHIHIATKHPKLVDDSMTQTIMASFTNPDILNANHTKKKKKKKRKISSDIKAQNWSCNVCSFSNTKTKQKCIMCNASK